MSRLEPCVTQCHGVRCEEPLQREASRLAVRTNLEQAGTRLLERQTHFHNKQIHLRLGSSVLSGR